MEFARAVDAGAKEVSRRAFMAGTLAFHVHLNIGHNNFKNCCKSQLTFLTLCNRVLYVMKT